MGFKRGSKIYIGVCTTKSNAPGYSYQQYHNIAAKTSSVADLSKDDLNRHSSDNRSSEVSDVGFPK